MYPREIETSSKERDGGGEGKSLAYERGSVPSERFCLIILGRILERGINFRGYFFFRTGYQFRVPGSTYPPKKNPSAPPPGFI